MKELTNSQIRDMQRRCVNLRRKMQDKKWEGSSYASREDVAEVVNILENLLIGLFDR